MAVDAGPRDKALRPMEGNGPEMNSGEQDQSFFESPFSQRFAQAIADLAPTSAIGDRAANSTSNQFAALERSVSDIRLGLGIDQARGALLAKQAADGYFVAELEGDTILESEYILLLAFLGQGQTERAKEAANYLLKKQNPDGGWSAYPGGPTEVSGASKAYLALKITGHDPEADYMLRAKEAVLAAGGVEQVNSFTRYYFAMLGLIPYDYCPAVPPEMILQPDWSPVSIYQMSAWSRTIVVPLSLLWAFQPVSQLPSEHGIGELYRSPECGFSKSIHGINNASTGKWFDWGKTFRGLDRFIKLVESCGVKPLRKRAVKACEDWILSRLEKSDGLGAIFPPIIWTIIGLKAAGYRDDHPAICQQFVELEKLVIREEASATHPANVRLQPCLSPVWDTAISVIALRDAGVPVSHPAVKRAVDWLLSKEARTPGDWSRSHPETEPGGWYFEFNNEFYPDVDDTAMVLIALSKCLPAGQGTDWKLELSVSSAAVTHGGGAPVLAGPTILAGRSASAMKAMQQLEAAGPIIDAMQRGVNWLLAMQSRNGGWGAFDADNDRELLTKVPFADHNAMIDPATGDISARVLEAFAGLGLPAELPAIQRALTFIWADQEEDYAWFGRWGVNYIYGTWQVIVGLVAMGISPTDARIRRAADWLKSKQQECGGWGETVATYDDPSLRGTGEPTASQTAWAVLGLLAAGEAKSAEVERGIEYLLACQTADGTWDEPQFTGTGFPRVFYLRYHFYSLYFPLMALARYRSATSS